MGTTIRKPKTRELAEWRSEPRRPLVSLVVPAYNEAASLKRTSLRFVKYMESLEDEYRWELIFINDGSPDGTGEIAEAFARSRDNIRVYHHSVNFGSDLPLNSPR